MSETDFPEADQFTLFDLLARLAAGWRLLVGGLALGLLATLALFVFIKPTYEAAALLQTGKVAGAVIEDVPTMVERLKSASFHLEIAEAIDDTAWIEQIHDGNGNQILSAVIPKSAPAMVEIKVKARTPDFAIKIADAATRSLIKRQTELSAQLLKKINFDLVVAKEKLAINERDLQVISKILTSTPVKDDRFSQVSLLTSLKVQKESEVFSLRQTVYTLEASLLPPATQPARVLEAIFASPRPVSPKKGVLLALGLFGGLLSGAIMVFVSSAWKQARLKRSENRAAN